MYEQPVNGQERRQALSELGPKSSSRCTRGGRLRSYYQQATNIIFIRMCCQAACMLLRVNAQEGQGGGRNVGGALNFWFWVVSACICAGAENLIICGRTWTIQGSSALGIEMGCWWTAGQRAACRAPAPADSCPWRRLSSRDCRGGGRPAKMAWLNTPRAPSAPAGSHVTQRMQS